MPVPSTIDELSTNAAENAPQGTDSAKGTVDNYFRAHASFIAQLRDLIAGTASNAIEFLQAGVGAVPRTVQDELRDHVSVKQFGAVLNGATNDAPALAAANAAAVAAKVPLLINGVMHIGSPVTITAPVVDGMHQMFSTTSQVTIDNGLPVRPEWWGASAEAGRCAVNALPAAGGVVKFANKRYDSPFTGAFGGAAGINYLDKPNIRFVGEKRPEFKDDNTQLLDGSGTIINGVMYIWAENFEIENFGIDSGTVQRARLGLTNTQDGLVLAPPTHSMGYFRRKASIRNVISLGVLANDFGHNILFEGYQGGTIENCEGRCAIHGIVIKSSGISGGNLTASGHISDNFIFKSDTYGPLIGLNLTNLYAKPMAGATPQYGVMIEASTAGLSNVNISNIEVTSGAVSGVRVAADGDGVLYNVNLTNVVVDGSENGIYTYGAKEVRWLNYSNIAVKNAQIGMVEQGNVRFNTVNGVALVNCATGIYTEVDTLYNNVFFDGDPDTVTTFLQYAGAAKPTIGLMDYYELTNYDNLPTPTFLNGWANYGGGTPAFDVFMRNGEVNLSGFIKPGTNSKMCNLPVNFRPPLPLYMPAVASNGSALVVVDALGDVYVEATAGATWVSLQNVSFVIH
jgi:hypothetical protein